MSTRFHFEGCGRDGRELIIDACNVGGEYYEVMAMTPAGDDFASARVSSSVEARKTFLEFLRRFVIGFQIRENEDFGSLEIFFDCKPLENVRDALKAMHFRWNGRRGCWYGFADFSDVFTALCNSCYGRSWSGFLSLISMRLSIFCAMHPFLLMFPRCHPQTVRRKSPQRKPPRKPPLLSLHSGNVATFPVSPIITPITLLLT